jgi:fructosamine-3-kinase
VSTEYPGLTHPWDAFVEEEIGGSDFNRQARLSIPEIGPAFAKWNPDAPDGFFDAEARSLVTLAGVLPNNVPNAVHVEPTCLVLPWIEPVQPTDELREEAGRALARLHSVRSTSHGFPYPGYIGLLPQLNDESPDFETFYLDTRIGPQVERARDAGLIDEDEALMFERAALRLVAELPEEGAATPSLVHGDLWAGNVMYGRSRADIEEDEPPRAWLIDPATAFTSREFDIASALLLGGLDPVSLGAYEELLPLEAGYRERLPGFEMYWLLVNANHFGGGFARRAVDTARRLL